MRETATITITDAGDGNRIEADVSFSIPMPPGRPQTEVHRIMVELIKAFRRQYAPEQLVDVQANQKSLPRNPSLNPILKALLSEGRVIDGK